MPDLYSTFGEDSERAELLSTLEVWRTSGEEPPARIVVLGTEDGNRLGRCPVNPERWMWLVLDGEALPAECDDRCSEWKDFRYVDSPLFVPTEEVTDV